VTPFTGRKIKHLQAAGYIVAASLQAAQRVYEPQWLGSINKKLNKSNQ